MKIYIAHNEFSHACPTAISPSGNEVIFDLDKISGELKKRLYGQMGLVELSVDDMNEIKKARRGVRTVSQSVISNIYK